MLVINFKTYSESTGSNALQLAKACESVSHDIVVCVQPTDIHLISSQTKLQVFAQHTDLAKQGKNTGYILPEAIKAAGAKGTLLNHAEHRIPFDILTETIRRCNELSLKAIACTDSLVEVEYLKQFHPYAIAFEDPALIGSGQSITKSKSETIIKFADLLKGTNVIPLCGAGISTHEDVVEAEKLGTKGVLVASAITLAKNPKEIVEQLHLK